MGMGGIIWWHESQSLKFWKKMVKKWPWGRQHSSSWVRIKGVQGKTFIIWAARKAALSEKRLGYTKSKRENKLRIKGVY